jgi:poly(3-hydroxybutyrate) depolymerase
LACNKETASKIAAFAAAAPAVYLNNRTRELPDCKPERKVPFMELHGLKDGTANYTGGLNSRSNGYTADVVTYVNSLAKVDGFTPSKNTTSTLCTGDQGKEVKKFTWDGGKETLVHYRYENVAHDWMSATGNEDTKNASELTCMEAEATKLMLDWFKKWTL